MRHLVTGGSGFLGNLIARRLAARGEVVRILDVWEDASRPQEIEFVHCDVRDRPGLVEAMQGVDVVHHNAALVPLRKAGRRFWEVNVEGSRNAAEAAVEAGVSAFVHMSSSAIYGVPESCPITSETPTRPAEIYGKAKLAGEQAVREVAETAGMTLIVIRPRTILGLGRLGIFQILFKWISEGANVFVIGSGDTGFQFVHAHDLMDFYMLAVDRGSSGAYNVGTDRFGTLREALENLVAHAGTKTKVKSLPEGLTINALRVLDWMRLSPLAPWHYLTYHKPFYFDVQPLVELGWTPRYSNDEMLRESYDSFLAASEEGGAGELGSPHRKPVAEMFLRLAKWFS